MITKKYPASQAVYTAGIDRTILRILWHVRSGCTVGHEGDGWPIEHPGIRRVIKSSPQYDQTRFICAQDFRSTKIINVSLGLNVLSGVIEAFMLSFMWSLYALDILKVAVIFFQIHSFYCQKIEIHLIVLFWSVQFVNVVRKTLKEIHFINVNQVFSYRGILFWRKFIPSLHVAGYTAEWKTNKILTNASECSVRLKCRLNITVCFNATHWSSVKKIVFINWLIFITPWKYLYIAPNPLSVHGNRVDPGGVSGLKVFSLKVQEFNWNAGINVALFLKFIGVIFSWYNLAISSEISVVFIHELLWKL